MPTYRYNNSMKSLQLSLIDYSMTHLKAIAETRAVALDTIHQDEAVELLAEALLSPAAMAIVLADLNEEKGRLYNT